MFQNGKLMPNLNQQSTKLLNLTVLQRIDPFIEEILVIAAHVTFYEFNIDLSQWSRKDVEGSLFVVKRNIQPRFQFIVMNRRNTENLVENLLENFEYEVQVPYLLYRNAAQEVNGIWFYNTRECEEVANLFSRILNAYSKVPQKSKVSSIKSEFEELEALSTLAVMDGPLEPSSSTAPSVIDVPDDPSFLNFFSTAMTIGNTLNVSTRELPLQSSAQITIPSHPSYTAAPSVLTLQMASPSLSSSATLMPNLEVIESVGTGNQISNLIKPSSFLIPPSSSSTIAVSSVCSSMPTAPPLHPNPNVQRHYGTPMLQPFPPPTPPPSLTPTSDPVPNYGLVFNREKVQDALSVLVQDNQFIDMVYGALLKAPHS